MRHAKAVLVALCCSMLWGCSLPLGPLTTASSSAAVPDHAAVPAPGGQPPAYAGPSANEITLIVDTYAVRKNTALKTPSRELFAKADGGSLLDFDAWNAQYEAKDAAKNGTTPATSKISIKVKAALGWVRSGPSQTLVVSAELDRGVDPARRHAGLPRGVGHRALAVRARRHGAEVPPAPGGQRLPPLDDHGSRSWVRQGRRRLLDDGQPARVSNMALVPTKAIVTVHAAGRVDGEAPRGHADVRPVRGRPAYASRPVDEVARR